MNNAIKYISPSELIPGEFHPHLEYTNDNIENLTNSIKNYGILEPLIVRPKDKKYEIILGNRRYKAALELGLETVPVIVLNINDEKTLELIISDNLQRKELSGKEEAYLYDKALSYPNSSKEKLSMNLGIPLDRITSKLNLLKKTNNEKTKDLSLEQQVSNNNENLNNSVNNDIINLSELNKKEEREDYNMNNNQFIGNDNTQNTMNTQGPMQSPQEPSFGGRFFPSLEDEPTNMNLNGNIGIVPTPQPQSEISQPAPLIDLTDLSIGESQNNINLTPPTASSTVNPIQENVGMPEQSNVGIDTPQQPIDINATMIPVPPMDEPINISNLTQQPTIEKNFSDNQSFGTQPQEPITINQPQIPDPIQNIDQPTPMIDPGMSQSPINIDNIPTPPTLPMDNQFNQPIDINNPIEVTNQKDVLPVVNMIKNIAISLETFGYKLNVTESDQGQKYNITIEIEK